MKIIKLIVEGVKRITAVEITPDGHIVVVGGANGAGKTSVLDAIEMVLAGGKSIPDVPIHTGKRKARIVAELDDGMVVERRFTPKGSYLSVGFKNGNTIPAPQKVLDKLVGPLSFDPLAFTRQAPKDQLVTLKQLVGVDCSDLEEKRGVAYGERTLATREARSAKAQLEAAPHHPDAPAEEISIAKVMEQLRHAEKLNAASAECRRELDDLERKADACRATMDELARQVAEIKGRQTKAAEAYTQTQEDLGRRKAELGDIHDMPTEDLQEQLAQGATTNGLVKENAAYANLTGRARAAGERVDELTGEIEKLDAEKAKRMGAVSFPVDGLGFDEDLVTLGDLPLSQASSAEQLQVSVAIGLALNPKLRLLLIRDGSLLDESSRRLIGEMAERADAQLWIEIVGEGEREEFSVIIEDGHVKGQA